MASAAPWHVSLKCCCMISERVLTICSRIQGLPGCEGVTLGLPHLVGAQGALSTIPLRLRHP